MVVGRLPGSGGGDGGFMAGRRGEEALQSESRGSDDKSKIQ